MTTTTSSSTTTYDPATTASSLATAYTSGKQELLTAQTTKATNTASGLTKLQSALTAFDSTLTALSAKSGLLAHSATFSDSSVATATATASASAGSYSFFVKALATANELSYSGISNASVVSGDSLSVTAGSTNFTVDLAAADTDGTPGLSAKEIATAINAATGNNSAVIASVITVSGQSQLILQSANTGTSNAIVLGTSGISSGALKTALDNGSELVGAQDADIFLGGESGTELKQASNTYAAIDGVSMTFNKAMATGTAPVTLTVANDTNTTANNVQAFITAYNTLQSVLSSLSAVGDPATGAAAGVFANDSGLAAITSHMTQSIRTSVGGVTLANYGITADRYGTLSLDQSKLTKKLAANPDGLNTLFGSTTTGSKTGVLGDLDKYVGMWTNSANGQISVRQTSVTKLKASLTDAQTNLDAIYNSVYARYLAQFTQLQTLQAQMAQNTSIFNSLFSTSSN